MILRVDSPTRTLVERATPEELASLERQLTYTNSSVSYMLSRHYKNKRLKFAKPDEWAARKAELESNVKKTLISGSPPAFKTGFIPYIKCGDLQVLGEIRRPKGTPLVWAVPPEHEPYPYQLEAMIRLMREGHGAVEMATGLGKSLIMLLIARNMGLRTVIVTPSVPIFEELYDLFTEHLGEGVVGCYGDGKKNIKLITVAVAKSLTNVQPGTRDWELLSSAQLVESDEAHTNPAETNEKVYHGLFADVPYRFFFSATQTRNDGAIPMLKSINGRIVYVKTIKEGIDEGYLCRLELNVRSVDSPRTSYYSIDAQRMKRFHYLRNPYVMKDAATLASVMWKLKREQSLILVEEIEQIPELIKRLTVPFTYVHGNTTPKPELTALGLLNTKRKAEIARFNSSEVAVMIGTRSVSTGTNFYPTHHTMDLQGGASEVAFKQGAIGRSTRLYEKSRYWREGVSTPKNVSKIWTWRIRDVDKMESHLEDRIGFFSETGCPVIGAEP